MTSMMENTLMRSTSRGPHDLHALVQSAGGVAPAERRSAIDEVLNLPTGTPDRWMHGLVLRGVMTDFRGADDTVAPGALAVGSVSLQDDDGPLSTQIDYLIDEHWAALTRTRDLKAPVLAAYEYGLLRVDALVLRDGSPLLLRGHSHLTNPIPPALSPGDEHLAAIFVPYFSDGEIGNEPTSAVLLPCSDTGTAAVSASQSHLLPAFELARAEDRTVRITCWGDSVTAGGSSSSPETAFPQVLARLLRSAGVDADISTVAVGGSSSAQWLGRAAPMTGTDWDRVAASSPDVLILEFVNDAELPPPDWPDLYDEILRRTRSIGADLLILEPHFTRLDWMRMVRMDAADPRPYVAFLRSFARDGGVAVASTSRRWERLFSEAIPYPTLLRNGINHPDDRGHRIFAEEAAATLGFAPGAAAAPGTGDSRMSGHRDGL